MSFLFYFAAWIRKKFITLISEYLCQQIQDAIKHSSSSFLGFTALEVFRETRESQETYISEQTWFLIRTLGQKPNFQASSHHLNRFGSHLGKLRDLAFAL